MVIHTFNRYTHLPIRVLLAKDLVTKVFGKVFQQVEALDDLQSYEKNGKNIPYLITDRILGADLVGIRYKQLWTDAPLPHNNPKNAFRVIAGDFVTTDDGTGIVHTAPDLWCG